MAVARTGSSEVGTTARPEEKQGGAGAEPTGGGPRMSKRRFYLLIGLGLAAVAIIAGGASTLWQAHETRIEAERAQSVSKFLQAVIGSGDLSAAQNGPRLGPAATVSSLLDSAASRLPHDFVNDPEARAEIHLALGRGYLTQQRWAPAKVQFQFARQLAGTLPKQPRVETARALQGLASIAILSGGPLPREMTNESLQILEHRNAQGTVDYARSLRVAGIIAALDGAYARADTLLGRSVAVYQRLNKSASVEKAVAMVDHTAVGEATG